MLFWSQIWNAALYGLLGRKLHPSPTQYRNLNFCFVLALLNGTEVFNEAFLKFAQNRNALVSLAFGSLTHLCCFWLSHTQTDHFFCQWQIVTLLVYWPQEFSATCTFKAFQKKMTVIIWKKQRLFWGKKTAAPFLMHFTMVIISQSPTQCWTRESVSKSKGRHQM